MKGMSGSTAPEVTTPVSDVLRWLARVSPEVAAELLIGCGFHDGESENLTVSTVDAFDVNRATITLAGSGNSVSLRRYRDGEFIDTRPGAPLAAAIAASRTPAELRDEVEQLAVRRAGFDPGKLPSGDACRAVLGMAQLDAAGRMPDAAQRMVFYQAVRAGGAGTARAAVRLLRNAFQRFESAGQIPEDLHWQMAALLRQAGDWRAAVQAAGVLYSRRGLAEKTRLYLASTMAASLLELATVQPTSQLLAEAERALKIVSALHPDDDDELKKMWRKLDGLRG